MSATLSAPVEPESYMLLGEIAFENKALIIGKSACEIVIWLCQLKENNNKKELLDKAKNLLVQIKEKIKNKEYDSSQNGFWGNKNPDKFWILEKLSFQGKTEDLKELSFILLDIFVEDIKNYEIVYKALVLIDEREAFNKFINCIENNLKMDDLNRNLFLGMTCYHFSDFSASKDYLKGVLKVSPINSKAMFYMALNHLMTNNVKDFIKTSEMILPESDPAL